MVELIVHWSFPRFAIDVARFDGKGRQVKSHSLSLPLLSQFSPESRFRNVAWEGGHHRGNYPGTESLHDSPEEFRALGGSCVPGRVSRALFKDSRHIGAPARRPLSGGRDG